MDMLNRKLHTKFGNATVSTSGYYKITSTKEGNPGKFLHRLIFEDFYGEIPEGYQVHHKNEDKTDNCILNLQLIRPHEHYVLHKKGKIHSDEAKKKMSENNSRYWLGKESPLRIKHARIVKKGFKKGKQNYVIKKDNQFLKQSVIPSRLFEWFTKNYPNELLVLKKV